MDKITKQTFTNGSPYALGINKNKQLEVIFQQKVNNDWTESGISYRYATAVLTGNEEIPIVLKKANTSKNELKLPHDYILYDSDKIDPTVKEQANSMVDEIREYNDENLEQAFNNTRRFKPRNTNAPNDSKKPGFKNPFSFYNKIYNFLNSSTSVLYDEIGIPVGVVFEKQQQAIDRPEKGLVYMKDGQIKFTGSVAKATFDRMEQEYGLREALFLFLDSDAKVQSSDNPDINKGTEGFLKKIDEIIKNNEKPRASSFKEFEPNDELFKTYINPLIQERERERREKQRQPKKEPKTSGEPSLTSSQKNILLEFKGLFKNAGPVAEEMIDFLQNFKLGNKVNVKDEKTGQVKEEEITIKTRSKKKIELFKRLKLELQKDSSKIVEAKKHLEAMSDFSVKFVDNPSDSTSLSSFIDGLKALIALIDQEKQQDLSGLGKTSISSHTKTTRRQEPKNQSRNRRFKHQVR